MKFNPTRRRRAEINVIPLIDILCMLLIFFIVTTSFKKKADFVKVTPPKSQQGTEGTPEPDKGRVSELTMVSSDTLPLSGSGVPSVPCWDFGGVTLTKSAFFLNEVVTIKKIKSIHRMSISGMTLISARRRRVGLNFILGRP